MPVTCLRVRVQREPTSNSYAPTRSLGRGYTASAARPRPSEDWAGRQLSASLGLLPRGRGNVGAGGRPERGDPERGDGVRRYRGETGPVVARSTRKAGTRRPVLAELWSCPGHEDSRGGLAGRSDARPIARRAEREPREPDSRQRGTGVEGRAARRGAGLLEPSGSRSASEGSADRGGRGNRSRDPSIGREEERQKKTRGRAQETEQRAQRSSPDQYLCRGDGMGSRAGWVSTEARRAAATTSGGRSRDRPSEGG